MRLFRCGNCRHRLRYGGVVCSVCYTPSPFANRKWFLLTFIVAMTGLISSVFPFLSSTFGAGLDAIQPVPLFWQTTAV